VAAFELNQAQTVVEPQRRKKARGGMSDEAFVGAFRAAAQDAEEYIDGHIAPLRAVATKFYRGEPFGNEEHGRSQIVMTELRDAVQGIMPSLLRIFVSGENVVEFIPTNANNIALADQQTEYVNHVFMQDNPGFLILYSAFKDALVRKTGVIKWRWADDVTVTETRFSGLLAEQIVVLKQTEGVEILEIAEGDEIDAPGPTGVGPDGQPLPAGKVPAYDVHIRRKVAKNRVVVECLPPEEFLIARDARSEDDASFIAHRSYKTVSEIVGMGYDIEEIEENMGGGDMFALNYEAQARNPAQLAFMSSFDTPDDSMRPVLFIEAYQRIDKDGDGIAELRKVHAIGDAYHILHDEIVDEAPFAIFCPDPEPHMVIGQSVADQTMDLQLIKSNIVRNMLDSLANSIHPRTVVVEGQVNLDDALNTEQGALIRARNINSVNELTKPFVGQGALPVITYMDQIKAKRTGVSDASQGLDPDVLQSTTKSAVTATVSGAQERIELYARIFAETAMKRLFKGVAKCLRDNQDAPRIVRLCGQYVPVDPRTWDGDLDVKPNVALGKGTDQDKLQFLGLVLQKQEQIMQVLGPVNPLAGIDKYRATLAQFMTLGGFKDASRYFGQITPQFMQQLQQSAQNPPPNPQMMVVQVEAQKAKWSHELSIAKFQQEQLEASQKDQREREKMRMDALVKMAAIEAQHGRELNAGVIDRLLQHEHDMASLNSQHAQAIHGNLSGLVSDIHGQTLQGHVDHASNQMQADVARQAAMQGPPSE
jgi:hypothetical protein